MHGLLACKAQTAFCELFCILEISEKQRSYSIRELLELTGLSSSLTFMHLYRQCCRPIRSFVDLLIYEYVDYLQHRLP